MNENAKKWVEALRSGDYKQTTGQLKRVTKKRTSYCCLGVACELYHQETGEGEWSASDWIDRGPVFKIDAINSSDTALPPIVQDWLGLSTRSGEYKRAKKYHDLASRNDARASFKAIANIIEQEPEGLFQESEEE